MNAPTTFLNGRVTLHAGDCRDVLREFPDDHFDSVVTDPPYALISITKRFGATALTDETDTSDRSRKGADGYARLAKGFMGQAWDNGSTAFASDFWREVLRALKPGGHVVAFGGTRSYHRLAVAIEDAGFEIRDQLAWVYGSGFPKSHDVSKGIDKRRDWAALPKLQGAIAESRKALGISQSEAARRMGKIAEDETLGGGGFMWFETGMRAPTREEWPRLKAALSIGNDFDACFEEVEREITGKANEWSDRSNYALTSKDGFRRDNPASDLARQWEGWGTALKPAWEPIALARKPLSEGTVAANVLRWGTGAINVGACRVGFSSDTDAFSANPGGRATGKPFSGLAGVADERVAFVASDNSTGRWPANLCHDGSAEVVAAFPTVGNSHPPDNAGSIRTNKVYGADDAPRLFHPGFADSGSAARFFYSAKADSDDRLGSKHPTVKPVDLMQWLVRLVTPAGGKILDPFSGTGTTGEAAWREGFSAVLIEREAEYQADIARRMKYALGGPDERKHVILKAKNKVAEPGPLFELPEAAE